MTANHPTKLWYVGATSSELDVVPIGRRLLDNDVVLWRSADGTPHALEDRCAHRAFPLSDGHVDDDRLVCGYHGCGYVGDGRCVNVLTQPGVPPGMSVRSYPVFEEPPFIWIWFGAPSSAQGTRPPRLSWLDSPAWESFESRWRVAANYLMVHEHFLDFSYAPIVHGPDLPAGVDRIPGFSDVEVTETTVAYRRTLPPAPLAGWELDVTGLDPQRSYWRSESGMFVSPAVHTQRWEITADGDVLSNVRTHALTPETATSTHVFQQASRNYGLDDAGVTARLRTFIDTLIERDTAILERVAAHSGYDRWRSGVEFRADTAALRARRVVNALLAREAGRPVTRPGWPSGATTTNQPQPAPKGVRP